MTPDKVRSKIGDRNSKYDRAKKEEGLLENHGDSRHIRTATTHEIKDQITNPQVNLF